MTNMAIESIIALQDEKTQFMTDFAVTLKEIRIAQTTTTAYSAGGTGGAVPAGGLTQTGAAATQAQPQTSLGLVPGVALPSNLLPGAQSLMTGVGSLIGPALSSIFKAML
jgi:hypothetical protein